MSIKRLDPNAKFRVVCAFDDALETETPEELGVNNESRYSRYLETFDLTLLRFKPEMSPTIFVVRPLLDSEQAELHEQFYTYDTVEKKAVVKNKTGLLLRVFQLGCLGIEENGSIEKISSNEIPYAAALEIGGIINLISVLGLNVKKA